MHNWTPLLLTLVAALILTLVPLPDWTVWLRPAWILLVLIYWTMTTPYKVGIGFAWIVGLIVDLITGTLLGEHALAYVVVIYFVSRIHIRLRMSPLLQQGFSILIFVAMYQFILFCIQGFIGDLPASPLFWLSALTSMLIWPWACVLMRDCRIWLT
jgi:rod shape-determining protein MreD